LQLAFAKAVLGTDIERESPRDDRVYDLELFLNPEFTLVPEPALGIASAELRQITVRVLGSEPYTINVALGAKTAAHTLQQALRRLSVDIKPSMLRASRVRIRVVFEASGVGRAPVVRQFDLTWPNSCNVTNDSYGILIQRMLVADGIEPKRPDGNEPG
jgi:hypothetical protein